MTGDFVILPSRGLLILRYPDHVEIDETLTLLVDCIADPEWRPGYKILIDAGRMKSYENNRTKVMKMQARLAEAITPDHPESLLCFYAPNAAARALAAMIRKSWEGQSALIHRVAITEPEALSILGQPETAIAQILATIDR